MGGAGTTLVGRKTIGSKFSGTSRGIQNYKNSCQGTVFWHLLPSLIRPSSQGGRVVLTAGPPLPNLGHEHGQKQWASLDNGNCRSWEWGLVDRQARGSPALLNVGSHWCSPWWLRITAVQCNSVNCGCSFGSNVAWCCLAVD